jgi:hypothetical protein
MNRLEKIGFVIIFLLLMIISFVVLDQRNEQELSTTKYEIIEKIIYVNVSENRTCPVNTKYYNSITNEEIKNLPAYNISSEDLNTQPAQSLAVSEFPFIGGKNDKNVFV